MVLEELGPIGAPKSGFMLCRRHDGAVSQHDAQRTLNGDIRLSSPSFVSRMQHSKRDGELATSDVSKTANSQQEHLVAG